MKFIGRISGIIAYSDDTHDQFAAHRDERGNISVNDATSSNQAIVEVQDENSWLENMIDLVSSTLALTPSGTAAKVVTSASMHFSGRVSNDNNTWEDFAVQHDSKVGGFILNSSGSGGTVAAYSSFLSADIKAWWGSMIGSANVATS